MSGRYASLKQKFQINKKLEEVCLKINGLAQYRQGWNDITVAEFINASNPDKEKDSVVINANHVAKVRSEFFGKLQTKTYNKTNAFKELEARVTAIENFLTSEDEMERYASWGFIFNEAAKRNPEMKDPRPGYNQDGTKRR